jgi:transposase
MNIRYRIDLKAAERDELGRLLSGGRCAARRLKWAQILLAANDGVRDQEIERTIGGSGSTIYRTKRRLVECDLQAALTEEPRPGAGRKLNGKQEALLVATACAKPPAGRARWTLELLAGEMIKLTDQDELSRERVRRRLLENDLKPWRKDMWCIPEVDAEYVARMEDVLDLYNEEPNPKRPVVCFDESPTQLIGEARLPIPSGRDSWSASTANTGATARPISSSSSTLADPGARSRLPTDGRCRTSQAACASWSMSISQTPRKSASCSTTCRHTRQPRFTRPFRLRRRGAFCAASSSTTRRATQAGSTWWKSRSASCAASASIAASIAENFSSPRNLGTAAKQLRRIHQLDVHPGKSPNQNGPRLPNPRSTSHNLCAEVLAVSAFPEIAVWSACTSFFSRLARRSLALRPARLRHHLYSCYTEGFSHFVTSMTAPCFRLERSPGGTRTHWKAPSHGARKLRSFHDRVTGGSNRLTIWPLVSASLFRPMTFNRYRYIAAQLRK